MPMLMPICKNCYTKMGWGKAFVPVYGNRKKGRGRTLCPYNSAGTILVAVHKCKKCGYSIDPNGHTFEKE